MCIYFSAWCLHVPAHKWFLHVGSNGYLMCPGSVVCLGIAASVLGSSPLRGFLSLQLTQKIFADSDCLLGLPNSPAAVVLLNQACVIHHMLSWAVRCNHDKCCFSLHETTMLASNFKPPVSSCALHLHNQSFVGMQHHNSKTGGCFIFRIKGIQILSVMPYKKS